MKSLELLCGITSWRGNVVLVVKEIWLISPSGAVILILTVKVVNRGETKFLPRVLISAVIIRKYSSRESLCLFLLIVEPLKKRPTMEKRCT
jgi:hypothetical protein